MIPRNLQLPSSTTNLTVTFESVFSLATRLDQLERNIEKSEAFAARLCTWLQDFIEDIHPGRPKKWMDKKLLWYYGKYKALHEKMSPRKATFEEAQEQAGQPQTPSQQLWLGQLAVQWCQAALGYVLICLFYCISVQSMADEQVKSSAADSRLYFLAFFPTAYRTRKGTEGHVIAAKSLVTSARNALKKGKQFHAGKYTLLIIRCSG